MEDDSLPEPRDAGTARQVLIRTAATAIIGGAVGAACLFAAHGFAPEIVLEMDRSLPRRVASGVYAPERAGERTFAWTARQAEFRFRGLSRESPWICRVALRGARGDPTRQPVAELAVDGLSAARHLATDDFQELEITAPRRSQVGLTLTITSSGVTVPAGDARELGLQIDWLSCRPADSTFTRPTAVALGAALIGGAAFGAVLGLSLPLLSAAGGILILASAQALPLSAGTAPYSTFADVASSAAVWIALAALGAVAAPYLVGRPLSRTGRMVLLLTACVLYLKLLGLLHPSKLLVDAVFQAHRLQAVLSGGYYFTQVMPSGVTFPYAIGLFAVTVPWTALTSDYVSLLRIIVCVTEAVAGALLYAAVTSAWSDRTTGVLAVFIFHLVPLPYGLIGNANLTNAFGQSVALIALVLAVIWPPAGNARAALSAVALFVITSLAFLSHISTAAHLAVTLVCLSTWLGLRGDRLTRAAAGALLAVTVVAAASSWVVYYGHFTDVYATAIARLGSTKNPVSAPRAEGLPATSATGAAIETSVAVRTADALHQTVRAIGWPIAILALGGAWLMRRHARSDRLTALLIAWGATYVIFLAVGVVPTVEAPFARYAAEFVGRVVFATYPAAVILAARATACGVRAGGILRLGSLLCLVWMATIGMAQWRAWFL